MTYPETHTHFLSDDHIVIKRYVDGENVIEIPWCTKCASILCPVPLFTIPDGIYGYSKGMLQS